MKSKMTLSDLRFIDLLPQFMKKDAAVAAMASVMDDLLTDKVGWIKSQSGWTDLDGATEEELDELAWELDLPWYDSGAPKSVKANLIRHSYGVFSKLGTKWALQSILRDYFDDVDVIEWMDYDGEPFHYKIQTGNSDLPGSRYEQFLWLLEIVKRRSAHLDHIRIMCESVGSINFAGMPTYSEGYHITNDYAETDVATAQIYVAGLPSYAEGYHITNDFAETDVATADVYVAGLPSYAEEYSIADIASTNTSTSGTSILFSPIETTKVEIG